MSGKNQSSEDLEVEEIDESIFHEGDGGDEDSIENLSQELLNNQPQKETGTVNKNPQHYHSILPEDINSLDNQPSIQQPKGAKSKKSKTNNNQEASLKEIDLDESVISSRSQDSVLNSSFIKEPKKPITPILHPKVCNYTFSLTVNNVLIQVIQASPQSLHPHFDCIALPYSDIPFNMTPCSSLALRKKIPNRILNLESTILDQTKRGRMGVSDTYSLIQAWFKNGEHPWKSGIVVRVPRAGEFDDRLLLFKSVSQVINAFEAKNQSTSLVLPWLADPKFDTKQAAQLIAQGALKAIHTLNNPHLRHLAICTPDPQPLLCLKSTLRRKLLTLLTK